MKLLSLAVAIAMATSACIADDADVAATSSGDAVTAATSDEMASGEMADDEMGHEHEHDHDEAADAIAWDGGDPPELATVVTGDVASGWDAEAVVSGFSFSDESSVDHKPGWGHTHVFLDGDLLRMSYEPVVHFDRLPPGPHQVRFTLSRNDHVDYSVDGQLISATATFTVPGEVESADVTFSIVHDEGEVSGVDTRGQVAIGDLIELTVTSNTAESVHVHGYDLFLDVEAGGSGVLRFEADIPGRFEVELEGSSLLLFELEVS